MGAISAESVRHGIHRARADVLVLIGLAIAVVGVGDCLVHISMPRNTVSDYDDVNDAHSHFVTN